MQKLWLVDLHKTIFATGTMVEQLPEGARLECRRPPKCNQIRQINRWAIRIDPPSRPELLHLPPTLKLPRGNFSSRAGPVATYKYTLPHHFIPPYCKQLLVLMFEKTRHLASAHREEKHYGCNEDSTKAWILWDKSAVMPANGERRTTANGQEIRPFLRTVNSAAHT